MIHPCILKQSPGEFSKHHGDSFSSQILKETWNHRIAEVGRFIWSNSHCTPALLYQGQLEHLVWCPDNLSISSALCSLTKPFHHRRSSGSSSMTSPLWIHADYTWSFFFVPCVGFQDWLFHHLPRVYSETVQTIVFCWVFFLLFQELKGLLGEILDCETRRKRTGFKELLIWEEFGLCGLFPLQDSW